MPFRSYLIIGAALTFCLGFAASVSLWTGPPLAWLKTVFREASPPPAPTPELRALIAADLAASHDADLFQIREYQRRALARLSQSHRRAPPLQLAAA